MDGRSPRLSQNLEEEKYVARMKKHLPEKYRDMCNMHLAFILNLSDGKLDALLDGSNSTGKKKLTLAPIFKRKAKTGSCLFGSSLSNESVCLMMPLIKFLSRKECMSKEGLFRKPGNRQRMRNLREALIARGPGVEIDPATYNAYDIAGVLKEFLRDLPEPLLSDKHMEAHKQINDLGKHATSPEEQARYSAKRLSALQLLMQILPSPFYLMTKQVLTLLHAVSKTSETKMTPNTLATIFAPIFFLDRKVSALEVCDAVKEAEPALTFLIENVEKLFKVPKELSVDIINYWKEMEPSSPALKVEDSNSNAVKLSQSYKIRKSISGRTLNTAVCYIDREQAKNVDVASNTQAELDNLFAHVQSLPDTPGNQRIKEMMARRSRTPLSSGRKHSRSKSIGASIRRIVPSLSKPKPKSLDMSVQSCATPYHDKKKNLSVMSDPVKSPALSLLSNTTTTPHSMISSPCLQPSPSVICQHMPVTRKRINADSQAPDHHCTPPKQECLSSTIESPVPSISDTNNSSILPTPNAKSIVPPTDAKNNTPIAHTVLCNSAISNSPVKSRKRSLTQSTSLPALSVATPQEVKDILSPKFVGESENEINYLPSICSKENNTFTTTSKKTGSDVHSPLARRPLRPCNAPGTPIMPRAALRLPRFTIETSL